MVNFRHWAAVLRQQSEHLRERADELACYAEATPGAVEALRAQADAFERAAEAIEEGLRLGKHIGHALVHARDLVGEVEA